MSIKEIQERHDHDNTKWMDNGWTMEIHKDRGELLDALREVKALVDEWAEQALPNEVINRDHYLKGIDFARRTCSIDLKAKLDKL